MIHVNIMSTMHIYMINIRVFKTTSNLIARLGIGTFSLLEEVHFVFRKGRIPKQYHLSTRHGAWPENWDSIQSQYGRCKYKGSLNTQFQQAKDQDTRTNMSMSR